MTTQLNNTIDHLGCCHDIYIGSPAPFDHTSYPFDPVSFSTGNWVGHLAAYAVRDGQIFLQDFTVGIKPDAGATLPLIHGCRPDLSWDGQARYLGLGLALSFSGALVLMREVDGSTRFFGLPISFPFQHRQVRLLTFEGGRLAADVDDSARMERVREALRQACPGGPSEPRWLELAMELTDATI